MNNSMALIHQNGNNNSLSYVDPSAVAAAESVKAQIQAAYMVAMGKPRDQDQARINIMKACKRPTFAEKVEYSKPVGGTRIIGPSIRFAELAIREWGNCRTESQTVYEDDSIRRIKVTVIDLETNASFGKEIQISKTVERKSNKGRDVVGERINTYGEKVYIVKATDDELANKEAAQISKVIRNEGLRLIPQDIIEEAQETARATMAQQDKKDPDAGRKKMLEAFLSIGIQPKNLAEYLGHDTQVISPAELQDLRSIYQTIKSGEAKWSDYIEMVNGESPATKSEHKAQDLKQKLNTKKHLESFLKTYQDCFDDSEPIMVLKFACQTLKRDDIASIDKLTDKDLQKLMKELERYKGDCIDVPDDIFTSPATEIDPETMKEKQ